MPMRLISSDGAWDVLYDTVSLYTGGFDGEFDGKYCICAHGILEDGDIIMGEYDTEEKMMSVMSDLHSKYGLMDTSVFKFPANDSMQLASKGWRKF